MQQNNDLLPEKHVILPRTAGTQIPLLPKLAERSDLSIFFFLTALDRLHQKDSCSFSLLHLQITCKLEIIQQSIKKSELVKKNIVGLKLNECY